MVEASQKDFAYVACSEMPLTARLPLVEALVGLKEGGRGLTWIHADDPVAAVDSLEAFGLHEIPLSGLREGVTRSRVEEYDDHVWVSFFYADPDVSGEAAGSAWSQPTTQAPASVEDTPPDIGVETGPAGLTEITAFVGADWIISVGHIPDVSLRELSDHMRHRVFARGLGALYVLFYLCEWGINTLYPFMDDIEERVDGLEDLIVSSRPGAPVQELFALKRETVTLRRRISPLRDVMQRISLVRGAPDDAGADIYFRDLHDDVLHLLELLDTYRDILSSALDLYLTTVSNRMNEIMKRLTVVATVFMPLTFITGFFGMNFVQLPFGSDIWFVVVLAAVFGSVAAMFAFFQKRGWW